MDKQSDIIMNEPKLKIILINTQRKMNTKRYLASIFATLILSISFLSCNPYDEDSQTKPSISVDVVQEVYGYYGKHISEATAVLDKKGWTKVVSEFTGGIDYSYYNRERTQTYSLNVYEDTIRLSCFTEKENLNKLDSKLANIDNKLLITFEYWEISVLKIFPNYDEYQGQIIADNGGFNDTYIDRELFLNDYYTKKPSINFVHVRFYYDNSQGYISVNDNHYEQTSSVKIVFADKNIW